MIKSMCERRWAGVLALAVMAAAARAEPGAEPDDESDSAPFTVAVEHGAGGDWRCSAALLSLRTALTSARCARGPPAPAPARDVWARATQPGAVPAATRVLRIALHAGGGAGGEGGAGWGAAEVAHDVALLELAEALGGARPILLAAARADCVPPRACYAVRALGASRLRIVELELRAPAACWPAAPLAPAAAAMCLAGPALCRSERGAGVVCGGKLCGVLSASLEGAGDAPRGCGAPHVAGSAPRWRRFLHCAHTRGACGRDGECAQLCSERWLEDEGRAEPPLHPLFAAPDEEPAPAPAPTAAHAHTERQSAAAVPGSGSEAPAPTRSPPPAGGGGAGAVTPAAGHHALEFDPNRQDFAAGEYGGAADYAGGAEEPAPAPAPAAPEATAAAAAAAAPPTAAPAREQLAAAAALEAQVSPTKKQKVSAASAHSPMNRLTISISALTYFIL